MKLIRIFILVQVILALALVFVLKESWQMSIVVLIHVLTFWLFSKQSVLHLRALAWFMINLIVVGYSWTMLGTSIWIAMSPVLTTYLVFMIKFLIDYRKYAKNRRLSK